MFLVWGFGCCGSWSCLYILDEGFGVWCFIDFGVSMGIFRLFVGFGMFDFWFLPVFGVCMGGSGFRFLR